MENLFLYCINHIDVIEEKDKLNLFAAGNVFLALIDLKPSYTPVSYHPTEANIVEST